MRVSCDEHTITATIPWTSRLIERSEGAGWTWQDANYASARLRGGVSYHHVLCSDWPVLDIPSLGFAPKGDVPELDLRKANGTTNSVEFVLTKPQGE